MTIVIRDAHEHEIDAISGLLTAAYHQYMPEVTGLTDVAEEFEAYRVEIADVRSRWDDTVQIVAVDGVVVGSVTYFPPNTAGENHDLPREWAGIRLLGVAPQGRGRGIGRMLTDECITRARKAGAPVIGLHTTSLMDVARAMYLRMGFERVSKYDFYPTPDFCVEAYRLDLTSFQRVRAVMTTEQALAEDRGD